MSIKVITEFTCDDCGVIARSFDDKEDRLPLGWVLSTLKTGTVGPWDIEATKLFCDNGKCGLCDCSKKD